MVSLDAGTVPWFALGAGMVSLDAGTVPLGAGMVPLLEMVVFVQFVNGMVPLDAGMVSLDAGTVPLDAGMVPLLEMVVFVQFINGMVPLVAGMVPLDAGMVPLLEMVVFVQFVVLFVLLVEGMVSLAVGIVVLQGNRYTGIVNMISEYLWVWLVEVMLEEVLLTAGLEAFCIVLLEEVTLVVPSGAGTVLFEVFANVLFSVVVVVFEEDTFEEDTFVEDTFVEDTFEEDTFEEDTFEEDTFGEGTSEHVSFTMRAREGSHNVALYSLPIKALR